MPNYCDVRLRVRGRRDCVDEFINVVRADYAYRRVDSGKQSVFSHKPHFYRIFEVDIIDKVTCNMMTFADIWLECAWSAYCCMMHGPFSYFNEAHTDEHIKEYGPNYGTTLDIESRRLHLDIELFSSEPGMQFQEHLRIVNGVIVADECREAQFVYISDCDNYEMFKDYYPNTAEKYVTNEQQFQVLKQTYPVGFVIGGFTGGEHDIDTIEDYPFKIPEQSRYLFYNVMCKKV